MWGSREKKKIVTSHPYEDGIPKPGWKGEKWYHSNHSLWLRLRLNFLLVGDDYAKSNIYFSLRFHVFGIGRQSLGFSVRVEVKTRSTVSVCCSYTNFMILCPRNWIYVSIYSSTQLRLQSWTCLKLFMRADCAYVSSNQFPRTENISIPYVIYMQLRDCSFDTETKPLLSSVVYLIIKQMWTFFICHHFTPSLTPPTSMYNQASLPFTEEIIL